MKIDIVSTDERYKEVCQLLRQDGVEVSICSPWDELSGNCLLLSVRKELGDEELAELFSKINEKTVVICGSDKRIEMLFDGKIIDYSKEDGFLQKNAYLTAEAAVSFLHSVTKESVQGKTVFVSGYGRIGRALCGILKCLGAKVMAYARREEVVREIEKDSIISASVELCKGADIIINTVPSPIFSKELIDSIPQKSTIVDLASYPFGFESMERVILGSGLPGRILPSSAAKVVYDTVKSILFEMEGSK